MALDTIGSIATHIVENFNNIPTGVSGNMIEIVDMNRQHVANFVGQTIGSNSIPDEYQPPIVNFSKADTIEFVEAQDGSGDLKLAELSIGDGDAIMSAKAYRMMAESQLNAIGRKTRFARVIAG